jgi:hypothetical protein
MYRWKVPGAFTSSNSMTRYLNVLYLVQKAIFYSSSSLILIWLNASFRSIFEKIVFSLYCIQGIVDQGQKYRIRNSYLV